MSLIILGKSIDLSHLARISRRLTLDLPDGKQKLNALVEFDFSSHCYSRRPKKNEAIPQGVLVKDGSKHKPRNRIFCPIRYSYSKSLVQRIDDLIANNGTVEYSRHQNFFSTSLVDFLENGQPVTISYFIFMSAKKTNRVNEERRITVFVESAYHEDPAIPPPVGHGRPIQFSKLLGCIWNPS